MDRGWIKLWRKTFDSTVFQHDGMFKLWCLCLMKVSHSKQEFFMDGVAKPVTIEPGQFITGRYQLHSDYHQLHLRKRKPKKLPLPSPITLRRWLLTLQEMQMLHIKTTNKYSVISITNWKRHQQNEHQVIIKRSSSDHIQECIKNDKETLTSLQNQKNDVPHKEILDLYHEILSELPSVKAWTKKRKAMLRARWQEDAKRQKLNWWKGYFEHVHESKFLMGENGNFQANMEWLINAGNLVKVIEGNYDR